MTVDLLQLLLFVMAHTKFFALSPNCVLIISNSNNWNFGIFGKIYKLYLKTSFCVGFVLILAEREFDDFMFYFAKMSFYRTFFNVSRQVSWIKMSRQITFYRRPKCRLCLLRVCIQGIYKYFQTFFPLRDGAALI